jgi:hypothetical protein
MEHRGQRGEHQRADERRQEQGLMIGSSIDWNASTKVLSSVPRPGMMACA